MRTLVLGGTGFIGSWVTRSLAQAGSEVAVFHRGNTTTSLPAGVREILGDRRALEASRTELHGFKPDVVVDIAQYTEAAADAVVGLFRGHAGRLVVLSSADVYRQYDGLRRLSDAPPDPTPLTEDSPLRERLYPYRAEAEGPADFRHDYEKILVERSVLGSPDLPGTVLRLPRVYGPGDKQRRLSQYLSAIDTGAPEIVMPRGVAAWRWTRAYVEDVAAAVALAARDDRAAGRIYNVGEASTTPEAEWAAHIGALCGWPGAVRVADDTGEPSDWPDLDWRYHLDTSSERLREELGYREPVARDEGLLRTIDWERANPPAAPAS